MVGEQLQARRPFTSPMLEMVIRENTIPEKDPAPVFPMDVIRSSDVIEAIEDDARQAFADVENVDVNRDINVTDDISMLRGLGEFREVKILVNVKGAIPKEVNEAVERLIDDGYLFSIIGFV